MTKFDQRISINSFAGYELIPWLQKVDELGFQSVAILPSGPGPKARHSLGEFPTLDFYKGDEAERQEIKEVLRKFKHISIHQAWDNNWKEWIDCAYYFGAKIVTIHHKNREKGESLKAFLNRQKSVFFEIGDYAQIKGINIGVENHSGRYEDYVALIKTLEHPAIGATLDIGHCSYSEEIESIEDIEERAKKLNELLSQLVRDLGSRICHFHIHNVKKYKDIDFSRIPHPYWKTGSFVDHRSLPEGEINIFSLFTVIKEINYRGMFVIELEEPEQEEKARISGEYLDNILKELAL